MQRRATFLFSLLIFLGPMSQVLAQDTGTPFITNYNAKTYGAHSQNWSAIQDDRGLMYFANNNGVLMYDGEQWSLIETGSIVRSLNKDASGTIYVGMHGDFGYLSEDERGQLSFNSLLNKVPGEFQEFGDVWQTLATPEGVFFQTSIGIYQFAQDSMAFYPSEEKIHISFWAGGKLFVKILKGGMMILQDGSLVKAPNSDYFKDAIVFAMLPYQENVVLLGTYRNGLKTYHLETGVIEPFVSEAEEFLSSNGLYHGLYLPSYDQGAYAFATLGNGMIMIDRQGNVLNKVTQSQGLQNDRVKFIYSDRQQNLWLALNNGISKVEINPPFKFYGESAGIKGKVYAVTRHQGRLLLGNPDGVYQWKEEKFEPYNGPVMQIWDWHSFSYGTSSILLMGTEKGLFVYDEAAPQLLMEERHVFKLRQSSYWPERLYVGYEDGFAYLEYQNGQWSAPQPIEEVSGEVRWILEVDASTIWLGTNYSAIVKVNFNNETMATRVIKYDELSGLEDLSTPQPVLINDSLVFFTNTGIKAFDPGLGRFITSDLLGENLRGKSINYYGRDAGGRYWTQLVDQQNEQSFKLFRLDQDKMLEADSVPFMRLPQMEIIATYHEANGISWIGSSEGLYRYDLTQQQLPLTEYQTVINQVVLDEDSVIYYGSGEAERTEIAFSGAPIQFQFAALSFEHEEANEYSYFLEGSDKHWSPWSSESKVRYTNLWEGDYVFRVKSKNVYGVTGEEAVYTFTVTPPLHRSLYAYITYVILFVLLVWGIVKINVNRLKRLNERLEHIVEDRVIEIREQKQEISNQKDELEKYLKEIEIKNAELKAYDRMVSHDLKGPIGLINSFAALLKSDASLSLSKDNMEMLNHIYSSSENAIGLIDGILEFAAAESPEMLEEDLDLSKLVQEAIEGHSLKINELKAKVSVGDLPGGGKGIPIKVYQLFYNLIGNALKFQAAGSIPEIAIYMNDQNEIVVEDNGIGFEQKYASEIFKPLHRLEYDYDGYGIGLGTCQRIADFHGWQIRAESEVGKGAKFFIKLS